MRIEEYFLHLPRSKHLISAFVTLVATLILLAGAWPDSASAQEGSRKQLSVYLFASSSCDECREVRETVFPRLVQKYGDRIALVHIPVDDIEAFRLQLLFEKHYAVGEGSPIEMFVGRQALSGVSAIKDRAEAAISSELNAGAVTPTPENLRAETTVQSDDEVRARLNKLKWVGVILVGLIDGINPCAFTTIVFFISLLAALGKNRNQLLAVGLSFAVAVFVTYLALGFGALKLIQVASVSSGVSRTIRWVVAGIAFVLAAVSFCDSVRYKRSGSEGILLKLPAVIQARIRGSMSRILHTWHLVAGSLVVGVLVTLLESVCTGQMYLPTIIYAASDPGLKGRASVLLVLYNVAFTVPLLVVFMLAYTGVKSNRLGEFSRSHITLTKILLGIVFLALGLGLLFS